MAIAFRGVLQARATALLGLRTGSFSTATCFAICHGETAALPTHFGAGIWLSWLRERRGSLLPGMLLHFTCNAMVVPAT